MRSKKLWAILGMVVLVAVAVVSYRLLPPTRPQMIMRHALTGYVLEVTPEMSRITVRNNNIPGTMASMVMDYRVKDPAVLAGVKPGDTLEATMIADDVYWLEDIKVTGKR
jgi:Cu/Ag efflux protein CusF